jgi:prepilin-type N-terminal cleavage/methylation domain-containing protein
MSYKPGNNKAFTLIELLVAIGILAMVMSFASVIFRVSIDAHRTAIANAEIMQKLRAITSQLDSDFKGARRYYGGYLSFGYENSKVNDVIVRVKSDGIVFFANGDFRSTKQYDNRTVAGNVACVFYALLDPNSYNGVPEPKDKVLVRRQTVLTSDGSLPDSASNPRGEYFKTSLSQLIVTPLFADPNEWTRRPIMNLNNLTEDDLVIYMAKGVDNFKIQYAPWAENAVQWLPVADERPGSINPKAFKFTFMIYDSKGVLKEGRPFTHIVCLD